MYNAQAINHYSIHMEKGPRTIEQQKFPENLHYIYAQDLEYAYNLVLHGRENTEKAKEGSISGEAAILYDIDGVFTDGRIRDVFFQSLYRARLVTLSCFVQSFPRTAHLIYTSRPQSLNRIREWIQPLKVSLATLPHTHPRHVEVIPFTPDKLGKSKSSLYDLLERDQDRLAIITDLAKEGSTKFLARLIGTRSKETRDMDTLLPMLKTVAKKHKIIILLDNDDTILEQVNTFALSHTKHQIYYISIPTNSYIVRMRNLKQRWERRRESRRQKGEAS